MKEINKISVDKLRLVALKYYSRSDNGVEYTSALSYAFVVKTDEGKYVNPFALEENYPVFEAAPFTNISSASNWEEYGYKLFLANDVDRTGPCYVSYGDNLKDIFSGDTVTIEMLREYMVKSKAYFKDRSKFYKDSIKKYPLATLKNYFEDKESEAKLIEFFEERGVQLQKVR